MVLSTSRPAPRWHPQRHEAFPGLSEARRKETRMTRLGFLGMLGAMFVAVALGACGEDNIFGPNPLDVEFAPSLGIDLTSMTLTETGLYYEDTAEGTGDAAAAGDSVSVTFSGWLVDGSLFDDGNFTFVLGVGQVIPGFDEGITGMQVGGTRKLVIPSSLAYGNQGNPPTIPGGAVLVFQIEVTAIVRPPG